MRIAHLDTGTSWRGGQVQVLRLLHGLRERGHESLLLAPRAALLERARAAGFVTVVWRPLVEWDPGAAWAAAGALRRARAELVHCHTARAHASGGWAGRLARLPVVVSRRVPLAVRANPASRLKYRLGVDRYLCVSRSVAESLRRSGIAPGRIAVVPSGVALAPPAAGEPAEDLRLHVGAEPGAALIGTLGALTAEKDHATLLEAAPAVRARFPDTHLVWIGEGPLREALERRVRRLGLEGRVHLLGFREDAPQLLRQLTLVVQPSRFEGLGNAVLEAQAAGVPVVATAVGGVPELIEDGVSGRLVRPGDPGALAAALIEALGAPAARKRWAERASGTVAGFDIARTIELTLGEYQAVLAERERGSESGQL